LQHRPHRRGARHSGLRAVREGGRLPAGATLCRLPVRSGRRHRPVAAGAIARRCRSRRGANMSRARTCRDFGYDADDRWAQLPPGMTWTEVSAVATDSRDRVFLFARGEHRVIVLDRDGTFLDAWGEGLFARPHGLFVGPDDAVYCTDDLDHTVRKFTANGRL